MSKKVVCDLDTGVRELWLEESNQWIEIREGCTVMRSSS